jgi:hypothetical protein
LHVGQSALQEAQLACQRLDVRRRNTTVPKPRNRHVKNSPSATTPLTDAGHRMCDQAKQPINGRRDLQRRPIRAT